MNIRIDNKKSIVTFSTEDGKKLDSYLKKGFFKFDFEKRTKENFKGVTTLEMRDYITSLFKNIYLTHSLIKTSKYDLSPEFNKIADEFNIIGFDINAIIKKDIYDEDNYNKQKDIICDYYDYCINNSDENKLNTLIELINKLNKFQEKTYKMHDFFYLKEDLMKNLKAIVTEEEYNHYNSLYESFLNEEPLDIDKIETLFLEIQDIILKDWKEKIDDVNDFKSGDSFKFICYLANNDLSRDYSGKYVHASLITENSLELYSQPYGFIMDPSNIVIASSDDVFLRKGQEDNYASGALPIVQSLNTMTNNKGEYNEIILDKFNPVGIFCITDGSKQLNPFYIKALELQKQFPGLPIIDIDATTYENPELLTETKNALVDAIEDKLKIQYGSTQGYYDYFSYFWDDFMHLKMHDYNTQDIIKLFIKHYKKLYMHIEEIVNSDLDDEFVLKLINAIPTYKVIFKIFNNNFDTSDIEDFYNVYGGIEAECYSRLEKLFPGFIELNNSLNYFVKTNNYDYNCFNLLRGCKKISDLHIMLNSKTILNNTEKQK